MDAYLDVLHTVYGGIVQVLSVERAWDPRICAQEYKLMYRSHIKYKGRYTSDLQAALRVVFIVAPTDKTYEHNLRIVLSYCLGTSAKRQLCLPAL